MFQRDTLLLLRIPFSWMLMPVFWLSVYRLEQPDWGALLAIGLVLHLLLYPASNAYNSHQDRDTGPIGGLEKPPMAGKAVFQLSWMMDVLGLILVSWLDWKAACGYAIYVLFSRLYSYRKVRLKQYPILGYLTVIINQGALIYAITCWAGTGGQESPDWVGMITSSLLIGGFYPLTQIYQHEADRADGVTTISMKLGFNGTFVFCSIVNLLAFSGLGLFFYQAERPAHFFFFLLMSLPILPRLIRWQKQVRKDPSNASFHSLMSLNWMASTLTNLGLMALVYFRHHG